MDLFERHSTCSNLNVQNCTLLVLLLYFTWLTNLPCHKEVGCIVCMAYLVRKNIGFRHAVLLRVKEHNE